MEILIILGSLFVAVCLGLLVKHRLAIECATVIASCVSLVASVLIAFRVATLGTYAVFAVFSIDAFAAIVMLIIASVGLTTTMYSVSYLRQETAKGIVGFTRVRQYYILLNVFLMAMFAAVAVNSPVLSWICIEATTLSTAFLISFYNKPSAIEAAWKYLMINSIGLLLGFFGSLLYFTSMHSVSEMGFVSWESLIAHASQVDPLIAKIAFIFVLIGYGTKVGLAPMHTWKPDAYSKAPNPIGALLAGSLLPVAFLMILKFRIITDTAVGPQFSQNLLMVFGILSMAVAAFIMFNANNYKRVLAYSSIENAGVVALGFSFGGLGASAAILHLIYHSLVKGVMFFSSGNILLKYHSAKIRNIKGAISVLPITSVLFIAGFLVVTGIPPFGIFYTKMQILLAGIHAHPVVSIVALALMTLVFIGFFKQVSAMFFGRKPEDMERGEESVWLIIPPMVLLIGIVILSVYLPPFLSVLIQHASEQY